MTERRAMAADGGEITTLSVFVRSKFCSECHGDSFPFPITQTDLADATGLTPVHANRMLRKLRTAGAG